jgi:predicted  nucleic acid-binding Zn-ribbon protein
MTFGDASPAFSSIGLLIQGNTQIGQQLNTGNEWHNFLGLEPLNHAKCNAFPAFNKFFVHTQQSTCADENNPTCFFKYHPRKITPDIDNEFFQIDPTGSPNEGCSEGSGTDELDRIIAQGLFETPIDNPAMGWVLERYLYQKFKENPALISEHPSFSSFILNKENGTVGRFYEIQKNIDNALIPAENLNQQSQQVMADLDDLMKSVEEVDEEIEIALSDSEYALLLQNKTGLLDQIEFLNRILDSLRIVYQGQIALNLQSVYTLNESVSTSYLYETNEKALNQIYLLSLTQQGGELTPNQVLTLQAIANQDPKFAGPAVYRALEMLPHCAKSEITLGYSASNGAYSEESLESVDRFKNPLTTRKAGNLIVSPNPAYSTFRVSGLSNSEGTLSLLDLQGRILRSNAITGNEAEIELAPNTPSGLYLIKIVLEDGSNHILKLVIRPK